VHLARRLTHLDGARDGAAALTFILIAEAAYTGSLLTVSALVLALSFVLAVLGEWRRALRLSIVWAIATAILMATMYVGFLPTLWHGVLPYVFEGGGPAASAAPDPAWTAALRRLGIFYDAVFPVLAMLGLIASRDMPSSARRVLACAVTVGGAILLLRYALPTALRDAKDVELLLAPLAVLSAAGLAVGVGARAHRARPCRARLRQRPGLGGRPRLGLVRRPLLRGGGFSPTRPSPRRSRRRPCVRRRCPSAGSSGRPDSRARSPRAR
jgi:hypothetical protein